MLVDYHVHVAAHGEYKYSWDWISQYLLQAYQQGIKDIGFSEHDQFCQLISYPLIEQLQIEWANRISIRLGMEASG